MKTVDQWSVWRYPICKFPLRTDERKHSEAIRKSNLFGWVSVLIDNK
jgi:hypothetical protein